MIMIIYIIYINIHILIYYSVIILGAIFIVCSS